MNLMIVKKARKLVAMRERRVYAAQGHLLFVATTQPWDWTAAAGKHVRAIELLETAKAELARVENEWSAAVGRNMSAVKIG